MFGLVPVTTLPIDKDNADFREIYIVNRFHLCLLDVIEFLCGYKRIKSSRSDVNFYIKFKLKVLFDRI